MFKKLLIVMVCIFTISGYLFSQNTSSQIEIEDDNDVSIVDETFANNTITGSGAAFLILNSQNINFTNTTFNNNTASAVGGAAILSGITGLSFNDTTFSTNSANIGGAFYAISLTNLTMNNVEFTGNTARLDGGASYAVRSDNLTMNNVKFTGNAAERHGGALYFSSINNITMNNVEFIENTSVMYGGAALFNNITNFNMNNVEFTRNRSSADGGAIYFNNISNLTMNNAKFTGNTAGGSGGAIFLLNNITNFNMNNVEFTGNTAGGSGGAIYAIGISNFNIDNAKFSGNTAGANGAAIYAMNTTNLIMNNAEFSGNTTGANGAAIYAMNTTNLIMNNAKFSGNTTGANGAAIYAMNTTNLIINNAEFSGNRAGANGGAISLNSSDIIKFTNASFLNNTAGNIGGAIYINNSPNIDFCVTSGNTSTFSNNKDSGGVNSIYFDGNVASKFNVNTDGNGVLDMFDGMKSSSTLASLEINKTGTGTWNMYGDNVFDSANTKININAGKFNIREGGQINLNGTDSSFTVEEGAIFNILVQSGLPAIVGDGETTIVDIKTQEQITIAPGSYVNAGERETFTIIENVSNISVVNPDIKYDDSHILLYVADAKLIPNGTVEPTTFESAVVDVGRHEAADVMPNLDTQLLVTMDKYMGGNLLLENILTTGDTERATCELTTLSHMAKASGSLHAYDVIGNAINQQILYGIKSRQAVMEYRLEKSKVPIDIGITPLFIFNEKVDEENNMRLGSELISYGGLVYFDMALPTITVTSGIGIIGGAGYSDIKSTGDYAPVENESIYYMGGLYYNLGYEKFRTTISAFYLGMKNEVMKSFGSAYKTDFLTHGVNVGVDFAYDFNFVKDLFFSPFITLNYSFYYHPELDTKLNDNVVFRTDEGTKHTFYIPVGFALSYDFYVKGVHIITPAIRFNGNIPVYDGALKTCWLLDDITTGQQIDNAIRQNDNIGIFDVNFNFSYKIKSFMLYTDYTFQYGDSNDMSHFVGLGVKVAL